MNKDSIRKYHRNVSGDFRNANGINNRGAARRAAPLDNSDRTLSVVIATINTTVVGNARIFGYNISPDETYNTANNVTVTIDESSHEIVKRSTSGSPFRIKGLIYETGNLPQLAKPFIVYNRSIAGATTSKNWQPSNFTDPRNFNATMIKTVAFQDVINADKAIEIAFVAGGTATMILTINDMLELSNVLSDKTPLKKASSY